MRRLRLSAVMIKSGAAILGAVAMSVTPTTNIPAQASNANGTVVGNLTLATLAMPQYADGRSRTIRIWTPKAYDPADTNRRYPVLYMHDGQNLFDASTSFAGEWEVDETVSALMADGYRGAIVVGVDNSADRLNELSPPWPRNPGTPITAPSGDKYASFIVSTVKPYVDAHFNTLPGRDTTGVGGSSMGGIISFYMGLTYPAVFGKVLAFSPSFPLYVKRDYLARIAAIDFSPAGAATRLYLYSGGAGDGAMSENGIAKSLPAVVSALKRSGYPAAQVKSHVWAIASHSEGFWAAEFLTAFDWLFLTDSDRADMAAATLAIGYGDGDNAGNVTSNLDLATRWDYSAKVAWKSSAPRVITARGKFTRPKYPTRVTLTATVTVGAQTRTRTFEVQVLVR
ncbi:MAG: hypothetical protein KGP01_05980 [Actinomycetales bacterium]|nr:hypothetical protein [Actinomycetales bacterium]